MVINFETPLKIRGGNKTSISYYGRPMYVYLEMGGEMAVNKTWIGFQIGLDSG